MFSSFGIEPVFDFIEENASPMKPLTRKFIFIFFTALTLLTACKSSREDVPSAAPPVSAPPTSELLQVVDTALSIGGDLAAYEQIGDDLPVSRAMAAKMLALAFNDQQSIDSLEREITFPDTDLSKWYDRYINAVVTQGLMSGSDGSFMPDSPLTLQQAQFLLDKINPNNKIKLQLDENTRNTPISYALWMELYQNALEGMDAANGMEALGIEEKSVVVLATPDNNNSLPAWNMIADSGPLTYRGFSMEAYIDKEISILVKESEVLGVLSLMNSAPTIKNAFVVKSDPVSITIFSGGVERTYMWINDRQNVASTVCDITIQGEKALNATFYQAKVSGIIKKTTNEIVELAETGTLQLDKNFKIYSVADGSVKWKSLTDLIIGTDTSEFFIIDGKTLGAVILKNPDPIKLRVAISTTGFTGLIHDKVSLTCTTDYTVKAGDALTTYAQGEILNISQNENKDLFGAGQITVTPLTEEGRIQLKNIKRAWEGEESPRYRGIFEISKEETGYIIVNEIGMEEYLYAVVPSEIPSSYGVGPSKVQAVTARSYAYNQFYANRYHLYGANIDDSVSCQVYNNIPENSVSIQAVDETKGLCLTYNGQVVAANFFSTSSGMTANSGDVWAHYATKEFPTTSSAYLLSKKQYAGVDYGDLSKEENASGFFKSTEIDSYDSGFSWFRWNVEMSAGDIAASINANLAERYNAGPALIKSLQADGVYRSSPITTIGDLRDLEITQRGSGGNIMEMKITGTKSTILVKTEYNIRSLIRPMRYGNGEAVVLRRKDGSTLENYSLMPSAFYVMEKSYIGEGDEGELTGIVFYGGGNGHGVGMSQNGAKGMFDRGYTFEEILKHYYPETALKKILS